MRITNDAAERVMGHVFQLLVNSLTCNMLLKSKINSSPKLQRTSTNRPYNDTHKVFFQ